MVSGWVSHSACDVLFDRIVEEVALLIELQQQQQQQQQQHENKLLSQNVIAIKVVAHSHARPGLNFNNIMTLIYREIRMACL